MFAFWSLVWHQNPNDKNKMKREERRESIRRMLEHLASRLKSIVWVLRDDSEMRESPVGDLKIELGKHFCQFVDTVAIFDDR